MLSIDHVLSATARELGVPVPSPAEDGEWIFELDGNLRLGILALPDGSAHVAWSTASEVRQGESVAEAEERATAFLGVHLGRLRRIGAVTATRDKEGNGLLYVRVAPETEREWLDSLERLLNETELTRKILAGGSAASPGRTSPYSGMSGLLRQRPPLRGLDS